MSPVSEHTDFDFGSESSKSSKGSFKHACWINKGFAYKREGPIIEEEKEPLENDEDESPPRKHEKKKANIEESIPECCQGIQWDKQNNIGFSKVG